LAQYDGELQEADLLGRLQIECIAKQSPAMEGLEISPSAADLPERPEAVVKTLR